MSEDMDEVIAHGEVIIVGNNSKAFSEVINTGKCDGKMIYDLVRVIENVGKMNNLYEGIAW